MISRRFLQCDVFSSIATKGNGLAVVVDGDDLTEDTMQSFAAWTNLAETTFLMQPTSALADYRVRIFTPKREMLFAGHPTLGSCASWLHSGGRPKQPGVVKQECGVGIVNIDVSADMLAFEAPETTVEPLKPSALSEITTALELPADCILRTAKLTNGPIWHVLELVNAETVLAADSSKVCYPELIGIGLIGAHKPGSECDYETRMLGASSGMSEDPITGSLNAAIGRWMYGAGLWKGNITIAQGTAIGRKGRVFLRPHGNKVWVGGQTQMLIEGTVEI